MQMTIIVLFLITKRMINITEMSTKSTLKVGNNVKTIKKFFFLI